jgi:crossover junction endodeoxyribonuclease RuvC
MVILAIDSGIERTGYSVFDKKTNGTSTFKYLTSGLIKTSQTKTTEQRLLQINKELLKLIKVHKPQTIVIEQLFFFKNQKTAIRVAQAQGVLLLAAAANKIPCEFLTPPQIKSIVTGYGQSDKKSVQKMLKLTLHLDRELIQDDQADAIACGLAYCYLNKKLI